MQKPAIARTPRHYGRVLCRPCNHKVDQFYNLLVLYMLAIWLTTDDIALSYSQLLALLLNLLLEKKNGNSTNFGPPILEWES
jgi:hypothetical protein